MWCGGKAGSGAGDASAYLLPDYCSSPARVRSCFLCRNRDFSQVIPDRASRGWNEGSSTWICSYSALCARNAFVAPKHCS